MRLTLDRQIAWAVLLVLAASMSLSIALHALSLRDDVDRQLADALSAAERTFGAVVAQNEAVLAGAVQALVQQPVLKAALASDRVDADTLQGIADEQRESLKVDALVLLGPDGKRRAASPASIGAGLDAWAGRSGALVLVDGLPLIPVRQMVAVEGRPLGFVLAARKADDRLLEHLGDLTRVESVLLAEGSEVAASARHPWTVGLVGVEPSTISGQVMNVAGTSVVARRLEVAPGLRLWLVRSRADAVDAFERTLGELIGLGLLSVALAAVTLVFFLRRVQQRVRALANEVATSAQSLQSAATTLKASATDEASRTNQHAKAIGSTRQTMGSMLDAASRITEASEGVSQRASHTASANSQLSASVLELSAQVQRISEISDTIRGIADRSDLLALNASLEGARAGEAGRGFALVGSEMRRLAEQVAKATQEVQRLAVDVRTALRASVSSSEVGLKAAQETSQAVLEIARLSQEQKAATQVVGKSMEEVGGLLERSLASSNATLDAAGRLLGTADRLETATRDFAKELGGGEQKQ
jgi:methyl-accepting chemotaxis protein